jgi:hypothetical protein
MAGTPTVRCRFAVVLDGETASCAATAFLTNGRVVCAQTLLAAGDGARVTDAVNGVARSLSLHPGATPSS